ncbi:MAG: aminopeptidase [Atopobiaceae bacterium]|jgi:aminopeptidase
MFASTHSPAGAPAVQPETPQEGLNLQIERYARLIVRKGVALQPGQELVVSAPVERADFTRTVVRAAYQAGSKHVTVIWHDDAITRENYLNVELEYFMHTPLWQREQLNSLAEDGAAFLFLEGTDPSALTGVDPAKPAAASRARNSECKAFRSGLDFGRNTWCIAGVPVAGWATKVFPTMPQDAAVLRLWREILCVARASGQDPEAEWDAHNLTFEKNKHLLNTYAFDALHYRSSNGTDLTLGLNRGGIWEGGAARTVDGVSYFPNIPTEEVFTTPDRNRAEGIVFSAMPLVHAGQIVQDFWLRFDHGRVVEYGAKGGYEVLKQIIETDEGATHLGECALIAKETPIRQSGILFYNTLYDENASCHLALGMGFPECIARGLSMSNDELLAHGINQSHTHVDFMIGTDDLCIEGITADGTRVPVFTNGTWSWKD